MKRLNTSEAADYLGVHPLTLGNWRKKHTGPPYYRMGRLIQYTTADLDKYLRDRRVVPEMRRVCKK